MWVSLTLMSRGILVKVSSLFYFWKDRKLRIIVEKPKLQVWKIWPQLKNELFTHAHKWNASTFKLFLRKVDALRSSYIYIPQEVFPFLLGKLERLACHLICFWYRMLLGNLSINTATYLTESHLLKEFSY